MSGNIQRKQTFGATSPVSGSFPGVLRRGEARSLKDAAAAWLKARGIVGNCRYRRKAKI